MQDIAPSNLLVRIGEYNVLNLNEPHKHIDRFEHFVILRMIISDNLYLDGCKK